MNDPEASKPWPEQTSRLKLLLLPGMDGTGHLFTTFINAAPAWIQPEIVCYPRHTRLSFRELKRVVHAALPKVDPFVLLAESFSTPIAIQLGAECPANMLGLILCAGFVQPPIRGFRARLLSALAPAVFQLPLPSFVIRAILVGRGAESQLIQQVREAISAVSPQVLSHRARAALACDETTALAKVEVPLLYLQPTGDRLISSSAFEAILRAKPDAILKRISGPHFLLQREPQAAADAIVAFIKSLSDSFTTSS